MTDILTASEVEAKIEAYNTGEMHFNKTLIDALHTIQYIGKQRDFFLLESIKQKDSLEKQLEAKDDQIKQLSEALRPFVKHKWTRGSHSEEIFELKLAEQALSVIPDVEGYRLEREVVEGSIDYKNNLNASSDRLKNRVERLLAHREKLKNDA